MTPNTLIERLRGLIRVPVNDGAGLLNDKDFFERQFPASKIALEAAARIEALEAEIERLQKALKEITWDGPIWRAQRIAREALGIEPSHVNQQPARD